MQFVRHFVPLIDRCRHFLARNHGCDFPECHRWRALISSATMRSCSIIPLSSGLLSGIGSASSGSTAIKTDETTDGLALGAEIGQNGAPTKSQELLPVGLV